MTCFAHPDVSTFIIFKSPGIIGLNTLSPNDFVTPWQDQYRPSLSLLVSTVKLILPIYLFNKTIGRQPGRGSSILKVRPLSHAYKNPATQIFWMNINELTIFITTTEQTVKDSALLPCWICCTMATQNKNQQEKRAAPSWPSAKKYSRNPASVRC